MLRKSFCKTLMIVLPLILFFVGSDVLASMANQVTTNQMLSGDKVLLARRGVGRSRGSSMRRSSAGRSRAPAARRAPSRSRVTPAARRVPSRSRVTPAARRVPSRSRVTPAARRVPSRRPGSASTLRPYRPIARPGYRPGYRPGHRPGYRPPRHYYRHHHYYGRGYRSGRWGWAYYGLIPLTAAILYYTLEGSPVYACQAMYEGVLYSGSVREGGYCNINVYGRTVGVSEYSVTVD